jgi:cytoskeletal protein RodZ
LLSWTQDAVVAIPQAAPAPPKRKHTLLPVLIVLFLISYGLMCMLAVEQDRTIASQRWLIRSLLSDSSELSSIKGKMVQKQYADAQAQAKAGSRSQAQTPLTQAPLTQVPMTQNPMTQDKAGAAAQSSHNAGKTRKTMPPKPPLGISDIVDGRRIVKTI